jgi:hypothetical protein
VLLFLQDDVDDDDDTDTNILCSYLESCKISKSCVWHPCFSPRQPCAQIFLQEGCWNIVQCNAFRFIWVHFLIMLNSVATDWPAHISFFSVRLFFLKCIIQITRTASVQRLKIQDFLRRLKVTYPRNKVQRFVKPPPSPLSVNNISREYLYNIGLPTFRFGTVYHISLTK